MEGFIHSVVLDKDKCKGCINCIKRCPTGAIRVRGGKANIISDLCIDCGECIRVCPHKAKKSSSDNLSVTHDYEYAIALPAPSFYAQFNNITDRENILNALLNIGFNDVFEVAYAAEIISDATKKYIESGKGKLPIISSACPVITRLIRIRYPNLIDNILPFISPVELAAVMAKREAVKKTGLAPEKIGCIFLSPCPAKVTTAHHPIAFDSPVIDAAVAVNELYPVLMRSIKLTNPEKTFASAGTRGISWGHSEGESLGLVDDSKYLAADGIENVIRVLEGIDDDKYMDLQFVELDACSGGCVGGVLQVENPYVARAKLKKLARDAVGGFSQQSSLDIPNIEWNRSLSYTPVMELGSTLGDGLDNYKRMQHILSKLPGIDCGCCGAPTCETFAQDILKKNAKIDDCIVIMRRKLENMLQSLGGDVSVFYKTEAKKNNEEQ